MRSNMLESKLGPPLLKKCAVRSSCAMDDRRFTFVPPLHRLATNTRIFQPEDMESKFVLPPSLLTHLSEEVLVLILEYLDYKSLVYLSKTCRLFHRLCLSNLIWRHRCRVDFGLVTEWPEYSNIYMYEMFHKAEVLKNDHNFFRPVSQLKTSVIVWYLLNPEPPSQSVGHLTPSQAKSIWGLTEEDIETHYLSTEKDRDNNHEADYPSSYYEWSSLYKMFVKKHGGIRQMQGYVLKRCLRNRVALEEHFQKSLLSSRQQMWYQFLEDRADGNKKALKALTEHMPRVTHSYLLHQITAMYIEGHLKGGFQTVKAYAGFCAFFKNWLDAKSTKLWPQRQGDLVAQDYRECLEYVNNELAPIAEEVELTINDFISKAKPYVERLHEVWRWQNRKGGAFRKEHRPSSVVRRHKSYRNFLERGRLDDFTRLKLSFERKEILVNWFKDNSWLHSLLGDYVVRSLRPACVSSEFSSPHYPSECVPGLVQRFLETGLRSDFTKIRMKLSEMASLQLQELLRKSKHLQNSIHEDVMKEDCVFMSEYDTRGLYGYFAGPRDPYSEYGRRIEVVTLD